MGDVVVKISGDSKAFAREINKMNARLVKMGRTGEAAGRKTGKAGKEAFGKWNSAVSNVKVGITSVLGALGIGMGVQGLVSKIVELTETWKRNMSEISRLSADAGREMTALAMMQKGGEAAEVVYKAAIAGAPYGYKTGSAWAALQQLQAQVGSVEGGMAAFKAAGRLSQFAGVEKGAAAKAVSLGMGLGMTAPGAARGIYAAGELSSLSPEEMAQMAPKGLPGWDKPTLGLAVASRLSRIYKDPGMLGTFTARARTGILGPRTFGKGKEKVDFWQDKMGLKPEADFFDRLFALKDAGYTTENALERVGFTEKRERAAISLLLRDIPGLWQDYEKIEKMIATPGLIAGKRAAAEVELPQMEHQRIMEAAGAYAGIEEKIPTTAAGMKIQRRAEEYDQLKAARHIAAKRMGWGEWLPDAEEGKVPGLTRWQWGKMMAWSRLKAMFTPPGEDDSVKLEQALREVLDQFQVVADSVRRVPKTLAHADDDPGKR